MGFYCRSVERNVAGKMECVQNGHLKIHFPSLSCLPSFLFISPADANNLVAGPAHCSRAGKVLAPSLPWPEERAEEHVHGLGIGQMCSPQTHILSRDPICPLFLQFLPFLFFFYSLINAGNELHMATAFTSLCEICSSCIVYQLNMFTTDAISV